jgi:hypothetical protein
MQEALDSVNRPSKTDPSGPGLGQPDVYSFAAESTLGSRHHQYIPIWEVFLYFTIVLDVFSRLLSSPAAWTWRNGERFIRTSCLAQQPSIVCTMGLIVQSFSGKRYRVPRIEISTCATQG